MLAQSRMLRICSAWVTERGIVFSIALTKSSSLMLLLSAKASNSPEITACSISASVKPSEMSASISSTSSVNLNSPTTSGSIKRFLHMQAEDLYPLLERGQVRKEDLVETALPQEFWRQGVNVVRRGY